MRQLAQKAFVSAGQEFLVGVTRALAANTVAILAGIGILALGGIWYRSLLSFLLRKYEVPAGAILLGVVFIVIVSLLFIREHRRTSQLFSGEPIAYHSWDLEWLLSAPFKKNSSAALGDIAPHFLKGLVAGPICPSCKRDVASRLVPESFASGNAIPVAGNSCVCGRPFDAALLRERQVLVIKGGMAHEEWLHHLRASVYIDAQAAQRKHEL